MRKSGFASLTVGVAVAALALVNDCLAVENPGWDYRVRNVYIPTGGYFDTGFVPTGSPKATIRCSVYATSEVDVFGTETRQAGCWILNLTSGKYYYRYGNKDHAGAWGSYSASCPMDLTCDAALNCYGVQAGEVASPGSMAGNTSSVTIPGKQYLKAMDIFYFKAEEGGEVKCELIPCVKGGVAQLYDTKSGNFITMSGTGTPVAGSRVADDGSDVALRGIVTTCPEPTADGWYVFGDPNYANGSVYGAAFYQTMVYPKWSAINLPADAKVKLVGGVVLESGLPATATLDISEAKGIYQRDATAFGSRAVTIPAGCYWFPSSCAVTETNSLLVIGTRSNITVTNDIVLNGTLRQSDMTPGAIYFSGRFFGTGRIESTNFGKHIYFTGPDFAFTGDNSFNSNYGGSVQIQAKSCSAGWKKFYVNGSSGTWEVNASYCGSRLVFNPPAGYDYPLLFDELSGYAQLRSLNGRQWRSNGFICLWGGHTIHAKKMTGSLHFVADSNANKNPRDANTSGYGNLDFDEMPGSIAYLSTNMNITVGTVSGNAVFDYRADSNAVNTATLRVTNSCASTVSVKASDVVALPSVMKGLNAASKVYLVETIEGETHEMPLDFAAAVVNPVGCDGSGTLDRAPSTGTIAVTFPTDDAAPSPVSGKIALAVFDHVGNKLDNWSVTVNGSSEPRIFFRDSVIKVMRDDTGIYLKVSKAGLQIFLK